MTYSFENLTEFLEKEKIEKLFERYKKERLYLRNFSEKTLKIYQEIFNRWQKLCRGDADIKESLPIRDRDERGRIEHHKLQHLNQRLQQLLDLAGGKPFKLAKLPEEKKTLRVFDRDEFSLSDYAKPDVCRTFRMLDD